MRNFLAGDGPSAVDITRRQRRRFCRAIEYPAKLSADIVFTPTPGEEVGITLSSDAVEAFASSLAEETTKRGLTDSLYNAAIVSETPLEAPDDSAVRETAGERTRAGENEMQRGKNNERRLLSRFRVAAKPSVPLGNSLRTWERLVSSRGRFD